MNGFRLRFFKIIDSGYKSDHSSDLFYYHHHCALAFFISSINCEFPGLVLENN